MTTHVGPELPKASKRGFWNSVDPDVALQDLVRKDGEHTSRRPHQLVRPQDRTRSRRWLWGEG